MSILGAGRTAREGENGTVSTESLWIAKSRILGNIRHMNNHSMTRRGFLATSTALAAGFQFGFGARSAVGQAVESGFKTRLQKSLIINKPAADDFKRLKDAGFEGVEAGVLELPDAEKCRQLADAAGMKIHSVIRGWAEFNSPDAGKYAASYATTEAALRAGQVFGAQAVLLVPCRIGGMPMPRPWEFMIDFEADTGHVTKVVNGDNAPYADYIKAHNHAVDTSREAVQRLIPLAEKTGVVIALENVWNNLWVKPAYFRQFVASFKSPWIKAYFDIGNHVKYAPPEEWILTLGDLIVKLHVKDFKLDAADPKGEGKFVNIRDGSIRWPVVRSAIDKIGYHGWLTIEGGDLSMDEHSRRLDLIIAGK